MLGRNLSSPMREPELEIRVLGELAVRREGVAVGLPASRKTRALLGYLVAAPGPVSRSRLCSLLWEGPVDPRGELRWSLSKLRALLGERATALVADGESVRLDPRGLRLDLAGVRATLARGLEGLAPTELAACESEFRGELLAGLELPDCFRFDAWLTAERETLRALRFALLERLSAHPSVDPEEALRAARSWVALDPLCEAAHAAVVGRLIDLGRPREAQRQAETCRRILRQELGVDPGDSLERARRRRPVGRGAPSPLPPLSEPSGPPESEAAAPERLAPWTGRQRELAAAASLLESRARAVGPRLLLVTGEPGIGKSRLLAELAARRLPRGSEPLWARGSEAGVDRAYGVWIELLRSLDSTSGGGGAALAELLPTPARGGVGESLDRERVAEALAAELDDRARGRPPLLLLLDDLQWFDEASVALLHLVLTRTVASPVLLAAAARDGEIAPRGAIARLLATLERDGGLARLPLAPLSIDEATALVRQVTPSADAARLARASGGHPLFALELARSGAGADGALPPPLAALVGERLSRLEAAARSLAIWAAAIGAPSDAALLAELSGLPPAELLAGLEELERSALLRADASGEAYELAHDLVRRAAYEQIAAPRRRFLHGAIARALAARTDPDGGAAESIARHAALGGEPALAAAAASTAGERALRLDAPVEARDLAERGLAQLERLGPASDLGLRLRLLRVLVHATRGRPGREGLPEEIHHWVEVARDAGRIEEVRLGLYLLAVLREEAGNLEGAEWHALRAAEAARVGDPEGAAWTIGNTGRCLAQIERDFARAEALLLEARELAERCAIDVVEVHWGLGLVAAAAGRGEEARRELERALELARASEDAWVASQCSIRLAALALDRGDSADCERRCAELDELAARLGEGAERPAAACLRALDALARALPGAQERLEAALVDLRAADSKGMLAEVLCRAAALDLAAGRGDRAAARAAEALDCATAVGRRGQIASARLASARAALARGDREAARAHIVAATAEDRPVGTLGGALRDAIGRLERQLGIPTAGSTRRRESAGADRGGAA